MAFIPKITGKKPFDVWTAFIQMEGVGIKMSFGRFNITTIGRIILLLMLSPRVFAAIGCTLTNPAEDLKYLFPDMTTYKEDLKEFSKLGDGKEKVDRLTNLSSRRSTRRPPNCFGSGQRPTSRT